MVSAEDLFVSGKIKKLGSYLYVLMDADTEKKYCINLRHDFVRNRHIGCDATAYVNPNSKVNKVRYDGCIVPGSLTIL